MMTAAFALVVAQAATPPAPAAERPAPPRCEGEPYEAFDFWVGEWEVFPTAGGDKVADSRIEKVSAGCAIRETWMPLEGGGGTSLSMLNHRSDRWEQTWMGANGRRVDFEGGTVGPRMVLTGYWDDIGGPGRDALIRMTYTVQPDGSVRQLGEASGDHGLGWVDSFDLTYRRKE